MAQVVCESPRIVCNPNLPSLIARYKCYVFKGQMYASWRVRPTHNGAYTIIPFRICHPDDFDWSLFSVRKNHITHDDLDNCYVLDTATSEVFPIYMEVPCGHCSICKMNKVNSFVERCRYETECYNSVPWFVTLTYDNAHVHPPAFRDVTFRGDCAGRFSNGKVIKRHHQLRKAVVRVPVGGLSKRDCQLFLKRFRINLQRAGFDFNIRYVLVGEYGHETHRPHYHAIFWGINSFDDVSYLKVRDIIKKSWSNGYYMARLVDPRDDKCFRYTAKYLRKDCEVPDGCVPTFVLASRGDGGIGSRFIDSKRDQLLKLTNTLSVENRKGDLRKPIFRYRSKWTGKIRKLQFSRYLVNRVFPSFCRSISSKLRKALNLLNTYGRVLSDWSQSLFFDYQDVIKPYLDHVYFFNDLSLPNSFRVPNAASAKIAFLDAENTIEVEESRLRRKNITPSLAWSLHQARNTFLSALNAFNDPVDIFSKARACKAELEYHSSCEVL